MKSCSAIRYARLQRERANQAWKLLGGGMLAGSLLLLPTAASAQEALQNSLAGEAAADSRKAQLEGTAYTFKKGDFRLGLSAAAGLDWNDNVYAEHDHPRDDLILRPRLGMLASYPLTDRNALSLDVNVGYDKYLRHNDLSTWYVQSGSALSFDFYVGDFWFNVHDLISYQQDSAEDPRISNTGAFGALINTAGLSGTWDLADTTMSVGYDHQNYIATSSGFDYVTHASEMVVARAGFRVVPTLVLGLEGSGSWTAYDQNLLNNSFGYSAGAYAEYRPSSSFSVKARGGYTAYLFDQTSSTVRAQDVGSWYAGLTMTHHLTEVLSYNLDVGHELRLGILSDLVQDWYVRPSVTWNVIKDVTLSGSLAYEHGSLSGGRLVGVLEDTYDWYGYGMSLAYSPFKKMNMALNYRLTLRSSNVALTEYTQNMVGLLFTYTP